MVTVTGPILHALSLNFWEFPQKLEVTRLANPEGQKDNPFHSEDPLVPGPLRTRTTRRTTGTVLMIHFMWVSEV